jgi:Fe2+ or Zn2+ uptake regulation protein
LNQRVDEHISMVAKEIKQYLKNHPHAADSAEGVMRWWLSQQRFDETVLTVQEALKYLVNEGELDKSVSSSGMTIYSNTHLLHVKDESN